MRGARGAGARGTSDRRAHARLVAAMACFVLAVCAGPVAEEVNAEALVPPKGTTFFGISDRGTAAEFDEFEEIAGKHPSLLQTFHPYGNSLNEARERWAETKTRPVLHISTADDETLTELITPRQIAVGEGDNYLLQLNSFFARNDLNAYVRPLGEPNRCLNPWTAITCSGEPRGGDHSHRWYKGAFRRIAIIVRGGGTLEEIDGRLANVGLPGLNRQGKPNPGRLRTAPIAMVWSPLPGGSPLVPGNYPGNYWPGSGFVDWIGSDIYSRYPVFRNLNHFFSQPRYSRKPFSLTEWAVSGSDDPRFVRRVFGWAKRRPRVRMLLYYRGFGEAGNSYRVGLYPRSEAQLRRTLRQRRFPAYAPTFALPPVVMPAPEPTPPGSGGTGADPRIESSSSGPLG